MTAESRNSERIAVAIATQQRGKHVSAPRNQHANTGTVGSGVFYQVRAEVIERGPTGNLVREDVT
jgi:hypothetical protein